MYTSGTPREYIQNYRIYEICKKKKMDAVKLKHPLIQK